MTGLEVTYFNVMPEATRGIAKNIGDIKTQVAKEIFVNAISELKNPQRSDDSVIRDVAKDAIRFGAIFADALKESK